MNQSSDVAVRGFRVAVNAVIEREGRVLLARRRDSGWWNLPGGGVEPGESVAEGLRREMLEEIGVEVEIVRLTGVYSKPRNPRWYWSSLPPGC